MVFDTLVLGLLDANCYVISDEPPKALIIDAAGDAPELIAHLEGKNLAPELLVTTHGHADHFAANAELAACYDKMKIAVGRGDARALTDPTLNMSFLVGQEFISPPADRLLDEGDIVEFARWQFRVLNTPGHTGGSISLFTEDFDGAPAVFSGDVIFAGSIGRSDIEGGDFDALIDGIKRKILTLPDETVIYPGHGPATTVEQERRTNPFLK